MKLIKTVANILLIDQFGLSISQKKLVSGRKYVFEPLAVLRLPV